MLHFPYWEYLDVDGKSLWMPHVDIVLQHNNHKLTVFPALVDTGATYTVIPSTMAARLGVTLDRSARTSVSTASGDSTIYASSRPITCVLVDPKTGERVAWETQVFFSDELETMLIGHKDCLEKFDVTFRGAEKIVEMNPL